MKPLFKILEERGLVAQASDPKLAEILEQKKFTLYVGFDPTAKSLHLGHLLPIMGMAHFQRAGHRAIALVGGATGMIGDPSGKSAERHLLTREQVAENTVCLKNQLSRFLAFDGPHPAVMLDNYEWISKMSFIDWLRDVGKFFKINAMIAKDSVKKRLESEEGISYTEFSYQTMQAYDFLHLHDTYECSLQAGGNDQWGNITAGIDLIRRVRGHEAYALTFPLVTTANGEKFGKSAGNAVWLDPEMTSPYQFYQYWINMDDRDLGRYLRYFTYLDVEEIEGICRRHAEKPEAREGQKILAAAATRLVHGEAGLKAAQAASAALFGGGDPEQLSDTRLLEMYRDVPTVTLDREALTPGKTLAEVLLAAGVFQSKGEVRRLTQAGGLYVKNQRVADADAAVAAEHLLEGKALLVRKGKKEYTLIRFV